jgi:hypothetical protein
LIEIVHRGVETKKRKGRAPRCSAFKGRAPVRTGAALPQKRRGN